MDTEYNEEQLKMMLLREEAMLVYLKLRRIEIGDDELNFRDVDFIDLMDRISKADEKNLREFIFMCHQLCEESLDLTEFDNENDFFYNEEFDSNLIENDI